MKIPKIIWCYHYVNRCAEVNVNDKINLKPDKINRWQIRGFIKIHTKAMPEYKAFGTYIHVPVAYINQKGCRNAYVPSIVHDFCCSFSYMYDGNIGYGESNIFGQTPNEVMKKVQEAFEKTYLCFRNSK